MLIVFRGIKFKLSKITKQSNNVKQSVDELLDLFVRSIVVICEYQLAASIQI